MEVMRYIEDLKDLLEVSSTIPLTGKVMVDKEEVNELLNQIESQFPQDLAEAQKHSRPQRRNCQRSQYAGKTNHSSGPCGSTKAGQ